MIAVMINDDDDDDDDDVGDPTTFGNLLLDDVIEDAVIESLKSKKRNGYAPSVGQLLTRVHLLVRVQ